VSDPSEFQPVNVPPPQTPPAQPQYAQAPPAASGLSDSAASGLAYFFAIPGIIFLIVPPYNQNATIRFHSWQSIFLMGAWIAWWFVRIFLGIFLHLFLVGFLMLMVGMAVGLGFFIVWLLCVIKAFNGQKFKIPVIGDLAEKQANG